MKKKEPSLKKIRVQIIKKNEEIDWHNMQIRTHEQWISALNSESYFLMEKYVENLFEKICKNFFLKENLYFRQETYGKYMIKHGNTRDFSKDDSLGIIKYYFDHCFSLRKRILEFTRYSVTYTLENTRELFCSVLIKEFSEMISSEFKHEFTDKFELFLEENL